jgi:hypothetical protein
MASILRSKAFWGITSAAGGIAAAVTYDNIRIKEFREGLLAEASEFGSMPSTGDQERKVSLVLFATDSEDLKNQKALFRKYSVDLLTKAGIDYQLIELDASQLDKKFYKDWEAYQIDHDCVVEEPADAAKPKVFFANNLLRPMMGKWVHQLNPWSRPIPAQPEVEPKDKILQKIREETHITPISERFFEEGLVALSAESFRALLWGYADWKSLNMTKHRKETIPNVGLVNCDFPNSFLNRIYYVRSQSILHIQ